MTERMRTGDFANPATILPGYPDSPHWRETSIGICHLVITSQGRYQWRPSPRCPQILKSLQLCSPPTGRQGLRAVAAI